MLSNHENRSRMRCKLVENLKFDSHFEASRLRDYSGYSGNYSNTSASSSTLTEPAAATGAASGSGITPPTEGTTSVPKSSSDLGPAVNLAQKLSINKEAINEQIKEDVVGEEEFAAVPSTPMHNQQQAPQQFPTSNTSQQSPTNDQQQQQQQHQNRSSPSESTISRTSSISTVSGFKPTIIVPAGPIDSPYEGGFAHLEEKEKLLIKSDCELITVTRVIKGK